LIKKAINFGKDNGKKVKECKLEICKFFFMNFIFLLFIIYIKN